jgi:hypothetical protein
MHRRIQQGQVAKRSGDRVVLPSSPEAMAHGRAQRIAVLTEACNAYVRQFLPIDGSIAAVIDMRRHDNYKALRMHAWLVTVWRDYNTRVAAVNAAVHVDALPGISADFSNNRQPPHTVCEILAEVAP